MASRINKKFLLMVITVAGGLAITVGAIALIAYRDDPTRNLRRAERAIADGDLDTAVKEYARAAVKRPSDLEILRLYEETLLKLRPDSQERAEELYSNWLTVLRQRAHIQSSDPSAQLPFLHELRQNALLTGQGQWWRSISEAAVSAMERSSPAVEGYADLEFLKLLADSSIVDLEGASAVAEVEQRFAEFVAEHPGHFEAAAAYAMFLLRQGHAAHVARSSVTAQEQFAKASQVVEAARQSAPESVELAIARARLLLARQFRGDAWEPAEVEDAIAEIARLVSSRNDALALNEAISVLPAVGGRAGLDKSVEILRHYLQQNPGVVLERYSLARLLFESGQFDEALPEIQAVLDSEPLTVSFLATYRYDLQLRSAQFLFFVEHGRAAALTGAEYDAQIERAKEARNRLAKLAPGGDSDLYVMECDAWLALSAREFQVAASKFHEVVQGTVSSQPRQLWGYARALDETGATGRALDTLLAAMSRVGTNPQFLFEVARLETKLGRFASAAEHLEQSLAIDSENRSATALLAQVRGAMDRSATPTGGAGVLKAAQDLLNEGDLVGARAALLEGLEQSPEDPALLVALIQVEIRGDWRDDAMARVEDLIRRFPESVELKALRESVRGGDAIEVLRAAVEARHSEPVDVAAAMYVSLRRLADEQAARAGNLSAEGLAEDADEAEKMAERADAEAENHLREAIELGAAQPDFIERRFLDALEENDNAEARRLADIAREMNADQARGLTYEARIELADLDYERAVGTLVEASRIKPYDSWIWRSLALTYLELGNAVDAKAAFNSAIEQNPNDSLTIRIFANLLAEGGDHEGALTALRDAVDRQLNDQLLREQWLVLEARHGDVARAIVERRRRRASDPNDRVNTLGLATLLGMETPARESILDANLEALYTERQWTQMGAAATQQAIGAEKQKWIAESDVMFEELTAAAPTNLALASRRALHYRNTGRAPQGRQFLESVVQAELARQPGAMPHAIMAQYLYVIGALEDAEKWLNDALPLQDPNEREIDRALANFYISAGNPQRALEHVQAALQGKEDAALRLLLAELHIGLGQFEDAERELAKADDAKDTALQVELLNARLLGGQGQALFADGRTREADEAFRAANEALDRAIAMRGIDPRPLVMKAGSLLAEYQRSGGSRATLVQDAHTLVGRALQMSAGYAPAVQMRAELLLAQSPPDAQGAARELAALLEANRWDDQTRRKMIELHLRSNNLEAAVALTAEGAQIEPHRAEWPLLLAQIHEQAGDRVAAAQAYKEAFARSQHPRVLQSWATVALQSGHPDLRSEVIATLGGSQAAFEQAPMLQCLYAHALALAGRFDEAREQLRTAHATCHRMVESEQWPAALAEWTRQAAETFRGRADVADLESFIRELSGGKLSRGEAFWLAREYVFSGEPGRPRAIELFQYGLDDAVASGDREDQGELHYHLGESRYALRQDEAAAAHYQSALEILPNHLGALNNLAYLYATRLAAPDKAIPLAERAVELAPNNANILDTYGVTLLNSGKPAEALAALEKSVSLGANAENQIHLAEALIAMNRSAEAAAQLERAEQLNPTPDLQLEINELRQRMGER